MIKTLIIGGVAAAAVLLYVGIRPQAYADELAPTCAVTLEQAEERLAARGGKDVALVNIPGQHADQMVVFTFEGAILAVMVKDGCVVSEAIPIDFTADPGAPV